jgi:hypothetical protein
MANRPLFVTGLYGIQVDGRSAGALPSRSYVYEPTVELQQRTTADSGWFRSCFLFLQQVFFRADDIDGSGVE